MSAWKSSETGIFVFLFILSYYFPYSNDDWVWGSKIGIERFENGFKDYNGRYLGNLLVILLTRSNIFKALLMTITYFGIGYFIKKIVNKKCSIVPVEDNGCIEKVKVQYQWNKNDTKEKGQFKGYFKVTFKDNIVMEDITFPKGDLIVPIAEELIINVL